MKSFNNKKARIVIVIRKIAGAQYVKNHQFINVVVYD
jgi:hypothetical protein